MSVTSEVKQQHNTNNNLLTSFKAMDRLALELNLLGLATTSHIPTSPVSPIWSSRSNFKSISEYQRPEENRRSGKDTSIDWAKIGINNNRNSLDLSLLEADGKTREEDGAEKTSGPLHNDDVTDEEGLAI